VPRAFEEDGFEGETGTKAVPKGGKHGKHARNGSMDDTTAKKPTPNKDGNRRMLDAAKEKLGELGCKVVGSRVKVYWEGNGWFQGKVETYTSAGELGAMLIEYDGGDRGELLQHDEFEFLSLAVPALAVARTWDLPEDGERHPEPTPPNQHETTGQEDPAELKMEAVKKHAHMLRGKLVGSLVEVDTPNEDDAKERKRGKVTSWIERLEGNFLGVDLGEGKETTVPVEGEFRFLNVLPDALLELQLLVEGDQVAKRRIAKKANGKGTNGRLSVPRTDGKRASKRTKREDAVDYEDETDTDEQAGRAKKKRKPPSERTERKPADKKSAAFSMVVPDPVSEDGKAGIRHIVTLENGKVLKVPAIPPAEAFADFKSNGENHGLYARLQVKGVKEGKRDCSDKVYNTCHQCWGKFLKVATTLPCRNMRKRGDRMEQCYRMYCLPCLSRWYGYLNLTPDQCEEMCPFCRGVCSCRTCLRKTQEDREPTIGLVTDASQETLNSGLPFFWDLSMDVLKQEVECLFLGAASREGGDELSALVKSYQLELKPGFLLGDEWKTPHVRKRAFTLAKALLQDKRLFDADGLRGERISCDHCGTAVSSMHFHCDFCGTDRCACCTIERVSADPQQWQEGLKCLCGKTAVLQQLLPSKQMIVVLDSLESCYFKATNGNRKANQTRLIEPNDSRRYGDLGTPVPAIPASVAREHHDEFLKSFQDVWSQSIPVAFTSVDLEMLWSPLLLFRASRETNQAAQKQSGNMESSVFQNVLDCRDYSQFEMSMHNFFKYYKEELGYDYNGKPFLAKLKDWPEHATFEARLPRLFQDFFRSSPIPEYTNFNGYRNMYSTFPEGIVKPDMGPKSYIAYGRVEEDCEGKMFDSVTKLHCDMSDAFNVLMHVQCQKHREEDELGECLATCKDLDGAVWDIFRKDDTEKISRYILENAGKFFGRDNVPMKREDIVHPIHDNEVFLYEHHLRELAQEPYRVVPFRFVQKRGDAVAIPAGCAHQVRNIHSCIKVAVDFMSPESAPEAWKLIQEYRTLPPSHPRKEDKLQLRVMLLHSASAAITGVKKKPKVHTPNRTKVRRKR